MLLKPIIAAVCLLYSLSACALPDTTLTSAIMSDATNLPLYGWKKVLMLRNGNTVVLHLAAREKMMVKIFDPAHKEVASCSQYFKIIGEGDLKESEVKGFYDINGIPVLFITQSIDRHTSLLRVSFSPDNGKITEEKIVVEGSSSTYKEALYLAKSPEHDDYAILYYGIKQLKNEHRVNVTFYNGKHEKTRTAAINLPDSTSYPETQLSFTYDAAFATYVSFSYKAQNRDGSHHNYLILAGAQKEDTVFETNVMSFPALVDFKYGLIEANHFSQTLSMVMSTQQFIPNKKTGKNTILIQDYYGIFDKYTLEKKAFNLITHQLSNEYYLSQNGTSHYLQGYPIRMHVNKYGITSLISEDITYSLNRVPYDIHYSGKVTGYLPDTKMCNIDLTKYDDEGNEITGIVLPKKQTVEGIDYVIPPGLICERNTNKILFREKVRPDYDLQFASVAFVPDINNSYLIFNEHATSFNSTLKDTLQEVYHFEQSQAICYKINKDDKISKNYLLGQPQQNESRAIMIESIDQQPAHKKLSGIVSVQKGKEKHLHVAWITLQ